MSKAGVNVRYAVDDREPTGTSCICLVGRSRSLVTSLGASQFLALEHLQAPGTRALMERAACFYLEAFHLGHCLDVVLHIAKYAANNDK
jgi:sugar/nucleoside kinase (ribokinase family)